MQGQGFSMSRVSAGQARRDFSSALNRVAYGRERIVLQRRGKDVAALGENQGEAGATALILKIGHRREIYRRP